MLLADVKNKFSTMLQTANTKDIVEEKNRKVKSLNETVVRLIKEKEHIGSLLRSALSRRMVSENKSKTNELFQTAENGLREAGIDFKFSKVIGDGSKAEDLDSDRDEIYTLVGALENIVQTSQLEIIELQHSVEELRAESSVLKEHVEAQAKELNHRMRRIEELEENERLANESFVIASPHPSKTINFSLQALGENTPSLGWRRNLLLVEALHSLDSRRTVHHARALEAFCSRRGTVPVCLSVV